MFSKFFGPEKRLVEGLIVGNLDFGDAVQLLNSVLDPFRHPGQSKAAATVVASQHYSQVPARVEMLLPCRSQSHQLTVLQLDGTNPEDPNSCAVQSLCNIATATPENEALAAVLMQIWKPMFFNELRTRQQLGYVVSSFMRTRVTHISLVFLVQTERAPEVALRSIEKFLDQTAFHHILSVLTDEEFLTEGFSSTFYHFYNGSGQGWLALKEKTSTT